jgi:pilus assembly protein CpaE
MRVVITQEQTGANDQVRQAILGLGLECGAGDCVSFAELPVRLSQGGLDLVLVRTGAEPAAALAAIRQAVALTGAPVLAVGPATDVQQILETTRSGAREYLDESRLTSDLEAALEKLRGTAGPKHGHGLVVAVASATPGSGVTTVATNLAFIWAEKHPEQVALVELGRETADLALCLDLSPRHTVTDVAQNWHRMDAALLRRSMMEHPGGVRVLAQKPETLEVAPFDAQAVRKAVILMRTMYAVTVLDLGHVLSEEHYEAMRLADLVTVVVRLDVPALRQTRRFIGTCTERGVPRDRIRLVANRYGQKGQIGWRKAEEAMNAKFADYIPDDSGKLNQALNKGQPLVRVARRSSISRRFAKLAHHLNGRVGH